MSTPNSTPPKKPGVTTEQAPAEAASPGTVRNHFERVPELPQIESNSDEDPGEQTVRIDPSLLNFDDVPDAE